MKEILQKTYDNLDKINKYFGKELRDCDINDITETFHDSKERLAEILIKLENFHFKNNGQLNELLIYIKLEYDNLLWCFDEVKEAIHKTLSNVPD